MSSPTLPAVLPTQFFYLYSTLSSDTPLGLSVDTSNDNAVVLAPWQGGQPSELWMLVDNGSTFALQSALSITGGTDLYLAVGGSNTAGAPIVVRSDSWGWNIPPEWNNTSDAANLLPNFQIAGPITTDSDGVAVSVQNGATSAGTPIVAATPDGSASQTWWIFPAVMVPSVQVPQWTRIASTVTDDEDNTLVIDLQNPAAPSNFATPLVLNLANASPSQMWLFSPSGYILNGTGQTNAMLTLAGSSDTYFQAGVWFWTADAMWSMNDQGMIVSPAYPNLALSISNPSSGSTLNFVQIPEGDPPPEMIFTTDPPPALQQILAMPPVQFPQFTSGDEATAFQSINQQLGLTNIRTQYLNTTNTSLSTQLENCTMPAGLDPNAWSTVVHQLSNEIAYVANVNALFTSYGTLHNNLFTDQQALVTTLGTDAQMQSGTSTNGLGLAIFSNIFFTLLTLVPVVGTPLAALGLAGMNGALSVKSISPSPFSVAWSDLWKNLSTTFTGVFAQLNVMQTTLVTDWGKLQAMNTAIESGPLAVPPQLTSDQLQDMQNAFSVAIMQILLPAQYQIYTYQDDNSDPVPGMSDYLYAQNVVQVPGTSDTWQKSWIALADDWDTYPASQALQNDVFDLTGQSWFTDTTTAWPFAVCWVYNWQGAGVYWTVVTVTNQCPQMLNVAVDVAGGASAFLPAFTSASVMPPGGQGGVNSNIVITDAVTGATVASFTVTMPVPADKGTTPSVSNQSTAAGYALSSPQCNQGAWQAFQDGYPGSVQITISTT